MSQEKINKIKEALKSKTLPPNTRKSLESSLKKLVGDKYGLDKDGKVKKPTPIKNFKPDASFTFSGMSEDVKILKEFPNGMFEIQKLSGDKLNVQKTYIRKFDKDRKRPKVSSQNYFKSVDLKHPTTGKKIELIMFQHMSSIDGKPYYDIFLDDKMIENGLSLKTANEQMDKQVNLYNVKEKKGLSKKDLEFNEMHDNNTFNDSYVIVKTWNGDGYSDANKIIKFLDKGQSSFSIKELLEDQFSKIKNDNPEDKTGAKFDQIVQKKSKDNRTTQIILNYSFYNDEDEASYQGIKLHTKTTASTRGVDFNKSYALAFFTNNNEVILLSKKEYDNYIKGIKLEIGDDLEDFENGKGRHFFDYDSISETSIFKEQGYEESDIQFEIINDDPVAYMSAWEKLEYNEAKGKDKVKPKKTIKKKEPKAKTEKTDDQISDFLKDCKKALSSADYKVSKIKSKSGSTKTVKRKVRNDNAILNSKMKSVSKTILKDIKEKDEPERYKQAKDIVEIISEITKKLDKLVLNKSISELATIKKFFEKF